MPPWKPLHCLQGSSLPCLSAVVKQWLSLTEPVHMISSFFVPLFLTPAISGMLRSPSPEQRRSWGGMDYRQWRRLCLAFIWRFISWYPHVSRDHPSNCTLHYPQVPQMLLEYRRSVTESRPCKPCFLLPYPLPYIPSTTPLIVWLTASWLFGYMFGENVGP